MNWRSRVKEGTGTSTPRNGSDRIERRLINRTRTLQLTQSLVSLDIILITTLSSTYDHRVWKTGLPVRSAVLKPHAGELVVGWVTTSESSLLYVFDFLFRLFGL
ncbi:hypothetical protein N7461_003271 [Penicillium sp. DV-2018c]|nr:hypothetical protein N7461_003271 [Penicillium sp. DV-2018c]